ncbi:retrovirus-related pol polyprotein from transposon TNT 1-94, partial [Trifolium medium]|nr:retrovirus-related pol polyprotein from transposon TNT 1-94 [Trifolium medium]
MPIPSCTCRQRCTCEAMCSARRNHLLLHTIRFLTGLNENFANVKSQILLMDLVPPMNKVFSMVIQYERHGKFAEIDDSKLLINAAKTSKSSSSSNSNVRHCTFCGKDNHFVENCFKKNGVPPHMKKFSSAHHAATEGGSNDSVPATNPSISQEQYDQLMILLQNSQLVQGSASARSNQVGSSMNAGHSSDSHKGASHHICNSLNWFQSYIEITPIKIKLPNGNFSFAKFSGVEKRYLRMIGSASEHEGLYYLDLTDKTAHVASIE